MFRDVKEEKNLGIKRNTLLSNSIEVLFEHLKENLFAEGGREGIFAERLLIVPSSGIQQWIQLRLAASLSISSGFTSTFLNKGVDILREKLFCVQKKCTLPTQLELFLRIEQEISAAMHSGHALWTPLKKYVQGKERRKISLARQLAQLFSTYGIYGNRVCKEWEKEPKNWQEALWAAIFRDWDYPLRALLGLKEKRCDQGKLSVHLFAFSHLSPLHFHFFSQVAAQVPVYLYQLSPCQEFWSDLNPREGDGNPLLASMGRVAREMARLIEESDTPFEEGYLIFGGKTQLKTIQRSLLTLQKTEEVLEDDSVQVHVCATRKREIETLHHNLVKLLAEKRAEPFDILVMAPQITLYAPYIEALFGKEIPYQIADMPLQKSNPLIEGLFLLFNLEKKRWNTTAVFELFHHTLFQKKQKLATEECALIKKWALNTGVKWGVDGENRGSLLKKGNCLLIPQEETATWLQGLGHLIEALALPADSAYPRIEFSQAELLGKVVTLLKSLQQALKGLDEEKTVAGWILFFKTLLETYFILDEESKELFIFFDKIERAARHFPDRLYSFALVETLLKDFLGQESATVNRNACQAIRFCSMLPMRTLPAKIICLLGMNHDAFPRKEEFGELDLLRQNPAADYVPSRIDFDRQLFLEALLSTRDKLLISYLGQDPYDLSELPPSSVLTELLPFISPKQIQKHSLHHLDPVRIKSTPPFSIKIHSPLALPTGEYVISVNEVARLSRSAISHYLYFQDMKIFEEEMLEDEEAFILSPLQRAILLKKASAENVEAAFKQAQKKGVLPPSLFGAVAKLQIEERLAHFPKEQVEALELSGLRFEANPSLTIQFVGSLEGVYEEGLYLSSSDEVRTAVKALPSFLLLNLADPAKNRLLFAASNKVKSAFFTDPRPLLTHFLAYYFYAKQHPIPLIPEWVEPILKRDLKGLEQAPIYDPLLKWQLKGRGSPDYGAWMETLSPLVESVYKEMVDAWF